MQLGGAAPNSTGFGAVSFLRIALVYIYGLLWFHTGASLVAQMVKNLPAMQETQVKSLGREDPLG